MLFCALAMLPWLVLGQAQSAGLAEGMCGGVERCDDSALLQVAHSGAKVQDVGRHGVAELPGTPRTPIPLAGKSIYFILTDRFARSDGNDTECGFTDGFQDNNWCNGTIQGIINQLDYIQGMGFECIWITPIVEQRPGLNGQSGYASHGYWAKNLYNVDAHYGTIEKVQELSTTLHARGMCLILDIVANHMGPIHSAAEVAAYYPFNDTSYYHQLNIGNMTFDEYTEKKSDWPPPSQCMGPGAMCALDSRNDCGCYAPQCGGAFAPACPPELSFNASSGCPLEYMDTTCRPGAYSCPGYNETVIHEGWFFDLGDLNQSDPFVLEAQLKWARWLGETYMLDGIRLDTAPYMPFDFLAALQEAAAVPILGEVTATNMTYHAAFQANPPPHGRPVLGGVLNFPLAYVAESAFCGTWFPYATFNLLALAMRTNEQLHGGLYKDLDLLGNFVDNHDEDRIAKACGPGEISRIFNSLAWTFFTKGMPIMYYGTETLMTEQRGSFWQYGWRTDTPWYKLVKLMNSVRKQQQLALTEMEVVPTITAAQHQLVLRRGGPQGTYAFLNNYGTAYTGAVDYCFWSFPMPSPGNVWVLAHLGKQVSFDDNCLRATETLPVFVLQLPKCNLDAMDATARFYYDIQCRESSLVGCRADGANDACRYCDGEGMVPCPAV